jgi:[methyl-Co(III) methanol-specific corrinoid protein]:coenzyme M methyltransferase
MMSFAVQDVMQSTGHWWPEAHGDAEAMATLALAMQQAADFDNVGVPFCMTVEAEALGAGVHYGSRSVQPRIVREPLSDVDEVIESGDGAASATDRRPVVIDAIRLLKERVSDVAIVGTVVGPLSLAGQLLEASLLMRAMQRQPASVRSLLECCTGLVEGFAAEQVDAGADVIMVADPTATGEILGAERYQEFAEPYLDRLVHSIHAAGAPVILHICGNARTILPLLAGMDVEAVSVDETVRLGDARAALSRQRLMGNVSADLLERGPVERIADYVTRALHVGVDIPAPACGVVATTPVGNLRALSAAARGSVA